ncbi:MAG: TetR/AcrR family transcriptional regulator [Spirochaetota bacterium]
MKQHSREHIIISSIELFNRHGIRRNTVESICVHAQVSKGTFYKYFRNKIHLLQEILSHFIDSFYSAYYDVIEGDIPFREKIRSIIRLKLDIADRMGPEFLTDLYDNTPEIREYLERLKKQSEDKSLELFHLGMEAGAIRDSVTDEFFLLLLDTVTELFYSGRMKDIFPDPKERSEALLEHFFYGILRD